LAGGVALNVVANSRCLREGPFNNLFVQPAAGDSGGSLGAAMITHIKYQGTFGSQRMKHVFLGPKQDTEQIRSLLLSSSIDFKDYRSATAELLEATVNHLIDGKVIGWFQGRMEFGPRALGGRSILADARRPEMRDKINALIKQREPFRPFAPAVLSSHLDSHFDLNHESPFMLEVCQVVSPIDLPSVTHIDGSARPQTVDIESNPRFAALLEAFLERTGCPILLNTSFNMRGEPIVCSAVDALLSFVRCKIDILVLEDYMIDFQDVPHLWIQQAEATGEIFSSPERTISRTVYTML
jgi:carbamoyltransferase